MNDIGRDAQGAAHKLLAKQGLWDAWQFVTREAIAAHLAGDVEASTMWDAVQRELRDIAPRPEAADVDIERSARLLIGQRGFAEARRHAMRRSAESHANLPQQVYWNRLADAVGAMEQAYQPRSL